ncbi:MAG: DUF4404 family protein [Pseudomonadaceae bacterium]|nr:MAG: DUF4404 family protein [Pseudomonadaceae bacterium]
MSAQRLKSQLESLQNTLDEAESPLTDEERTALQDVADSLQARLLAAEAQEQLESDPTLVDGVHLMVERFEAEHPSLTGTLRNIIQTLSNMGI